MLLNVLLISHVTTT